MIARNPHEVHFTCDPPITPLFPQTAKRSIVPPWGLPCWLRVALKPTTRARLAGMRVDSLLTARAWLRPAAGSVERLASEPGGLVPTTVTGSPAYSLQGRNIFPADQLLRSPSAVPFHCATSSSIMRVDFMAAWLSWA